MAENEDLMCFAEDNEQTFSRENPWRVLIVDDEPEIHAVTKLALEGFNFHDRPLEYLNAYSGAEACALMEKEEDVALILLDVVMESEEAGLEVVKYIRQQLHNKFVRIILRTGQSGQAPPLSVISEYDINDYKEKSELTSVKLITSVYTGLSCYSDMIALEHSRKGLEQVMNATSNIMEMDSVSPLATGILEQLAALLNSGTDAVFSQSSGMAISKKGQGLNVLASTMNAGKNSNEIDPVVLEHINKAIEDKESQYEDDYFVIYTEVEGDVANLLYIKGAYPTDDRYQYLIDLFCRNASMLLKKQCSHDHKLYVSKL